jgi:hypothetical protein
LFYYYYPKLGIRVECAFGIFVQKWGILRTAMPQNITIKKVIALVNALAKLHNFCIDQQDKGYMDEDEEMEQSTIVDTFHLTNGITTRIFMHWFFARK